MPSIRAGKPMSPLMTTFLACWFLLHVAALAWMIWEVSRANRK